VSPRVAVVPLSAQDPRIDVDVELLGNVEGDNAGTLALELPAGWTAQPVQHVFRFTRAGDQARFRFTVTPAGVGDQHYTIAAVATGGGREYREGYETIQQRDLETRFLYQPATIDVRGIDVVTVPGLRVGYVMGVGDQVPSGIAQLGASVTMLTEQALAAADVSRFDAIVTGTRAYAVREDLRTYNQRLLDYARGGGNLVVLYNTTEFDPRRFAPFPGELPAGAEEVSEEDAPVELLEPSVQALTWPNRITVADFDGWVEQRGSKFWSGWDAAYVPLISSHDKGQAPQHGGWLQARCGKGTYTYFAYAFHRQLPHGVPGAYRLLANVLALGKTP
jgi:hypothetical protein